MREKGNTKERGKERNIKEKEKGNNINERKKKQGSEGENV